jgi:hypothetical protein
VGRFGRGKLWGNRQTSGRSLGENAPFARFRGVPQVLLSNISNILTLVGGEDASSLHTHSHIATGVYTGNGATSFAAITDLDFTPSYVKIWESTTGNPSPEIETHEATIYMTGTTSKDHTTIHEDSLSESHISGGGNRILSMESGGFTVADGAADGHPNKNSQVYYYLAIG